jgi:hypothetical protein
MQNNDLFMKSSIQSINNNLFGWEFWVHLPLVLIANFSPVLVSWKIIILGTVLLWIQYAIFSGCVLTNKQFGKSNDLTFYTVYLEKMGFRVNRLKFKRYMRYIHPFVLGVVAFVLQYYFSRAFPLLRF